MKQLSSIAGKSEWETIYMTISRDWKGKCHCGILCHSEKKKTQKNNKPFSIYRKQEGGVRSIFDENCEVTQRGE